MIKLNLKVMNQDIKFGCSTLGKYTTVKINAKIDTENLNSLKETYSDWLEFVDNGRYGVRIEGVLPTSHKDIFLGHDLRIAILNSKASRLYQEVSDIRVRFNYPVETNTCWTKANLDEI
jgi:hypothetical protein